ncbi:MAG: hypothetical protein V7K67_09625 [Nostoc sp.]|uniref:hypothetical protein n=1 Tax=Nostoc sp. TaxID=1180 RepID=UPI002FF08DC4
MREHVSREKKTTTGFSIPSLKHPTHGFALESSAISRQAVPKIQPLHKPLTHDISRIPLHTQAKLSISQPGDIYEQEADSVAQQMKSLDIQRQQAPEDKEELQMKPMVQRSPMLMIGSEKREPIIQRDIENATYNKSDPTSAEASKAFFTAYNETVQKAYNYAITVPSLGAYGELNGYTKLWVQKWNEHLSQKRPKLMAAAFGYVIESLVSDSNSEFHPKISGEYSVDTQVTVGGTRPDLVLRLKKGSNYIAWLDLTASGSVDHIYTKDNWSLKVSNFAEVTYPSLDLGTLAFMQQNKDNKGGISEEDLKTRLVAAQAEYGKRKEQWKELGQKFAFNQIWKEMKKSRDALSMMPEYPRQFILEKLKNEFQVAELDEKLVPSILIAMGVSAAPWGYTTGYSSSEKAGEAWLIDNAPAEAST